MKRNLLLGLVLMFTFGATWAQRTVTGTVTGEDDGTPVSWSKRLMVKGTICWYSYRH
jgi:hypothetical protein